MKKTVLFCLSEVCWGCVSVAQQIVPQDRARCYLGLGFVQGESSGSSRAGHGWGMRQRSRVRDHCPGTFGLSVLWKQFPACCSVGRAWPGFPWSRWRGWSPRCSLCTWLTWGGIWGHGARCEFCHCTSSSSSACAQLPPRQEKLVGI